MADTSQFSGSEFSLRRASSTSVSSGQQFDQKQEVNNIVLSWPGRSEYQLISVTPGMAFFVELDLSCVTLDRLGHDLYLFFDQDATIVLQRFSELEGGSQAPVFFLPDGTLWTTAKLFSLLEHTGIMEQAAGLPGAGGVSTSTAQISIDNSDQTNDVTPTITGHSEPGSAILVELAGMTMATIADGNGNWSVTVPDSHPLPEGLYTVCATVTDAAGNMPTTSAIIGVDAIPPLILPAVTSSKGDFSIAC